MSLVAFTWNEPDRYHVEMDATQGTMRDEVFRALTQAIGYSFDQQKPDGHWVAEVEADATFTAEYVMFKYSVGLDLSDGTRLQQWLLGNQKADGSWSPAPTLPGNLSTSTEAYLALKILGVSANHPSMRQASAWIRTAGGVENVRFFTRFFLATFGLIPWSAVPQLPAELILLPPSFPLNIYKLSSWARTTLIPWLIVRHHEPVWALPNGRSTVNNFLDELWCNPRDKYIPFAPALSTSLRRGEYLECVFTLLDKILAGLCGLKQFPTRRLARKKCIDWLIEHQEAQGEWSGVFPSVHGSLWALVLEGYSLDHTAVVRGVEAMERLSHIDARGKRLSPVVSPMWDTLLMLNALCDAGMDHDQRVRNASDWVKERQVLSQRGDWRIYSPNRRPGGWSFQYYNTWYPDVDDTAVAVMGLVKQYPHLMDSEGISSAITWILGMQNSDGGFAAFDIDNDKLWLHKISFSDMDSLCDPSTPDMTGRVLECFGLLLSQRRRPLNTALQQQVHRASERAIGYLFIAQEQAGCWWGRWGCNYTYGTSNALRGLAHFALDSRRVRCMVNRATHWFESCQNADGGWGETLDSYTQPKLAGIGESTAAHTAWGVMALLPYLSSSHRTIERGIRWLIDHQISESPSGKTWKLDAYTGTGFPKVLYFNYPYYHHYFPLMALARYIGILTTERPLELVELPITVCESLNCPSVLIMAAGTRGDVQTFLNVAKCLIRLYRSRIRIATHAEHQQLVESNGFEFFCVAGDVSRFCQALICWAYNLRAVIRITFSGLKQELSRMVYDFWRATIDSNETVGICEETASARPFVADLIISSNHSFSHIHAAQKLQVPLALVSLQPLIATREFPCNMIMLRPSFRTSWWWNRLSYTLWDLLNWLEFRAALNYLRTRECGFPALSWTWATFDFAKIRIPRFGLWSYHFLPRPPEWNSEVTIAGYTFNESSDFIPPKALQKLLDTENPVLAVSFGSATALHSKELLSAIVVVVEQVGARAVLCGDWSKLPAEMLECSNHIFVCDYIPFSWLLPQIQGFVHHGGASHTSAGLRYGVPMWTIPLGFDQNFWAAKIEQSQLGPAPVTPSQVNPDKLTKALEALLSDKYNIRCQEMASKISSEEDGAEVVAERIASAQKLIEDVPCSITPQLRATWRHTSYDLPLSNAAAACLVSRNVVSWSDLGLEPRFDWTDAYRDDSESFVEILKAITRFFALVTGIIRTLLLWTNILGNTGDQHAPLSEAEDPVRQARIKQAEYDLHEISKHGCKMKGDGANVEDRIVDCWLAVSTARYKSKFTD